MEKRNTQELSCRGEEFRWGELKIMHVMKKHFDKIPYELYKPLVLWYLDHEAKGVEF